MKLCPSRTRVLLQLPTSVSKKTWQRYEVPRSRARATISQSILTHDLVQLCLVFLAGREHQILYTNIFSFCIQQVCHHKQKEREGYRQEKRSV